MSKLFTIFLLFLLVAALINFPSVRAQDGEADPDVEIDDGSSSDASAEASVDGSAEVGIDEASEIELEEPQTGLRWNEDLSTRIFFPTSAEKQFAQGEEITILVGVSNNGQKAYNLTAVTASLRSPYDFSFIVQNYTALWINSIIDAGQEMTIAYSFKPSENLEALEFPVEAFLYYNTTDSGDMYRTTVFNSTITITEKNSTFNPQTFFTYVLFIGLFGLGIYSVLPASATKKRSKKGAEQPAAEWTVEDYKPAQKSKVVRRSRK